MSKTRRCYAPEFRRQMVGPQRCGRVGRGLVRLGLRHRQGGARCRRLLVVGQAGQLAGSGGAEKVCHWLHNSTVCNTWEGLLSRVIANLQIRHGSVPTP